VNKAERERRQRLERGRRYRAEHAEERAAYTKKYREEHAEEIAAYRKRWREANLDHARESNRQYMRRRAAEERKTEERRQRKAAYSRARYHADVEASRAKVRDYLAGRRAADPDGFREGKKRRNDAWRARNREEVNRRQREKKRLDPSANARRAQAYYAEHAEERREYSRRYHEEHREQDRERSRKWRARERRRKEAGLPVRRLHRIGAEERAANAAAAGDFFAGVVTPEYRERVAAELRTPPDLIAAWERECERFRAEQYAMKHPETSSAVVNRRTAEEERMDAIARVINDRLRITPRRPEPCPQPDPYEPVAPAVSSGGIGL